MSETPTRAPVQGFSAGIPWEMHLRAYDAHCKKWGKQPALIDPAKGCRGGFGTVELDEFIPGWRDELTEIGRLTARIEELEKALAPFAKFVETDITKQVPDGCVIVIPNRNVANFTYGDLRRAARSTLEASDRNGGK